MATKKYLGINLTKAMNDLYNEYYITLMKEIEKDSKKWKDIPLSWIEKINIVKCPYYPSDLQIQPNSCQNITDHFS
jgi:hypothetical protein